MFVVSDQPLDVAKLTDEIRNPKAGALVVFEGWVRDHNEGHQVSSLEYEVYKEMANNEAKKIIAETLEKFDIVDISCVHREGHLKIGEMAVWIGATASHRGEAFKACQYAIDEIKTRLPIWKKEHYVDKKAEWVDCQGCYQKSRVHLCEKSYYSKQTKIKQVGSVGQKRLKDSHVLVVGAGGLGCPALSYLAGAGVGHITVCDGDKLENSNLHRQTLYDAEEIGEYKSVLAQSHLNKLNPFIKVDAISEWLSALNVEEILKGVDVVLDCSDNFKTKFLLHDACFLNQTPLVQASVYQFEGQLRTYMPDSEAGCLRCAWPEMPKEGCVDSCTDAGILGAVAGTLGVMQSLEALKIILKMENLPLESHSLFIDLLSMDQHKIKDQKNSSCLLCSDQKQITDISSCNYINQQLLEFEVSPEQLPKNISEHYEFIDIRDDDERNPHDRIEALSIHIALEKWDEDQKIDLNKNYLLTCQNGHRSRGLAIRLRDQGYTNIYSLAGGFKSL